MFYPIILPYNGPSYFVKDHLNHDIGRRFDFLIRFLQNKDFSLNIINHIGGIIVSEL